MASKKRRNIESVRTSKLDLGLEELISPVTESQGNMALTSSGVAALVSTVPEILETSTPPEKLSTFQRLYRERNFSQLAILSESEMQSDSPLISTEARLWWVRAQLEQRSVPLSILAAPLNSVSESIVGDISLDPTDRKFGPELYSIAAELLRDLSSALKSVDTSLSRKFSERAQLLDGKLVAAQPPRDPSEPKAEAIKIDKNIVLERLELPIPGKSRFKYVRQISAVALCILALWYSNIPLSDINPFASEPMELADVPLSLGALSAPLRGVELTRISGVKEIDALYYQMNDGANRQPYISQEPQARLEPEASTPQRETQSGAIEPTVKAPKNETRVIASRTKEKIDLSGPLEGTQFPELTLGVEPVKHEIELTRRSDLFGGRGAALEPLDTKSGTEAISPGSLYTVMATTKVLARPSYRAVVLGVLDRGARIEVVERQGEWLKLRSRMGQAGYILAQDAEAAERS